MQEPANDQSVPETEIPVALTTHVSDAHAVDPLEREAWRVTNATLSQLGTDVARVQGLVQNAVGELSEGFAVLSAQGQHQRDLLQGLLRPVEAGSESTSSGKQLDQFVAGTQQLVRDVVDSLAAAGTQTEQLAGAMHAAVAAMDQVGRMTRDIRRIADQTRMVALNASIEAAHAGRFGAAFSVVAEEITRLSADARAVSEGMNEQVSTARQELESAHGTAAASAAAASSLVGSAEGRLAVLDDDVQALEQHLAESLAGAQAAAAVMTEGVGRCVRALQFDDLVAQLSALSGQRIVAVTAVLHAMEHLRTPTGEDEADVAGDAPRVALADANSALAQTLLRQIVEQQNMESGDIELF